MPKTRGSLSLWTGATVLTAGLGAATTQLIGDLGAAIITGLLGLVGIVLLSGYRERVRKQEQRIEHLERELRRHRPQPKDGDDD